MGYFSGFFEVSKTAFRKTVFVNSSTIKNVIWKFFKRKITIIIIMKLMK
jgi:hypothetical protein